MPNDGVVTLRRCYLVHELSIAANVCFIARCRTSMKVSFPSLLHLVAVAKRSKQLFDREPPMATKSATCEFSLHFLMSAIMIRADPAPSVCQRGRKSPAISRFRIIPFAGGHGPKEHFRGPSNKVNRNVRHARNFVARMNSTVRQKAFIQRNQRSCFAFDIKILLNMRARGDARTRQRVPVLQHLCSRICERRNVVGWHHIAQ